MTTKLYTLNYLNLNNEIHSFTASDFEQIRKGFIKRRSEDPIIPMYMVISESDGKSYYIPQYHLFDEFDLKPSAKLQFLDYFAERELVSPNLVNALHQDGCYMGDLDSTEKSILDNLSIDWYKSAITFDYIVRF